MTLARRKIQNTIGDGNCAFNAFILAVTRPEILAEWKFSDETLGLQFLNAIHFEISDKGDKISFKDESTEYQATLQWVKDKITSLSDEDKQTRLQTVFRKFTKELALKDPFYSTDIKSYFLGAFDEYVKTCLIAKHHSEDDIFKNHQDINDQFYLSYLELIAEQDSGFDLERYTQLMERADLSQAEKEQKDILGKALRKLVDAAAIKYASKTERKAFSERIDTKKIELEQWWDNNGYPYFLNEMAENGKWAGDLEIGLLAQFFQVNCLVETPNLTYFLHPENGSFSRGELQTIVGNEVDKVLKELADREIILRPYHREPIFLNSISAEQVNKRLEAVSGEDIMDFISVYKKDDTVLRNALPFTDETLEEFIHRGVIFKKANEDSYIFQLDSSEAKIRIAELPHAKTIVDLLTSKIKLRPNIIVHHEYGHWSNTLPIKQNESHLDNLGKKDIKKSPIKLKAALKKQPKIQVANTEALDNEKLVSTRKKPKPPAKVINEEQGEPQPDQLRQPAQINDEVDHGEDPQPDQPVPPPVAAEAEVAKKEANKIKAQKFLDEYKREIKQDKEAYQYDHNKWQRFAEAAKVNKVDPGVTDLVEALPQHYLDNITLTEDQTVDYTFEDEAGKHVIQVTQKEQIALDRELAKKLQNELDNETNPGKRNRHK